MISGASFALNGFTLHRSLSLAELLVLSSVIFAVAKSAWQRSRSANKRTRELLKTTTAKFETPALPLVAARQPLISSITRMWTRRGASKMGPVVYCGCFCILLVAIDWATQKPPNYVLMHNVHVLQRTSDYSFTAEVVDPATREWYPFVITSCQDWRPTDEIQAGVTLKMLQYVEDRINSCDELDGKYAGYTLLRDEPEEPEDE
jgi:hypothetical protein